MANKFQIKRTTVSGRTANTTNAANASFIDKGELAFNLADRKLFSSDTANTLFEVGSNLTNLSVTSSLALNNDAQLRFKTTNGNTVGFRQQSDDNFVLYTTNTSGGERAVFSVFANTNNSNLQVSIPLQISNGLVVNNSTGSAGQVLHTNGTTQYYDTQRLRTSGQGVITANTTLNDSHFGDNLLAATAGITITLPASGADSGTTVIISNISGGTINLAYAYASDGPTTLADGASIWLTSDGNGVGNFWRKYFYTTSGGASSLAAGNGLGSNSTHYFVLANTGIIANTTGTFVNSAYIGTLSANNTTYVNGKTEGNLNVNNATTALTANNSTHAYGKTEVNLNVNSAGTATVANNSSFLGGTAAASYQLNSTLAANVATMTANNATNAFGKTENALNVNSAATALVANNATNAFGKTEGNLNVNTALTANNSTNLGGQAASFYAANSQLASYALLSGAAFTGAVSGITTLAAGNTTITGFANVSSTLRVDGIATFNANVGLSAADHLILSPTSAIVANGSFGSAGHVLHSNGSGAVYWAVDDNTTYDLASVANTVANAGRLRLTDSALANDDVLFVGTGTTTVSSNATQITINSADQFTGTVTSVASGNGLTGGPITTTGTLSVVANSGLIANSTGVFVNANTELTANSTGVFHNDIARSNNTSTASPASGGTFTAIDSITTNARGHVTAINTKTVTLPVDPDTNTTYDLLAIANTVANQGTLRLKDSANANDDVTFTGAGTTTLSSNATHVIINSADQYVGTVTSVATGNGLTGGPITATGTVSVVANSGLIANSTGVFVNANTELTANSTGVFHNDIARSNTTTGNTSPNYGGTFTAVDSITTNARGHVTAVNTKTVTMPSSNNTTYDLLPVANTVANQGIIRLKDSANANDDITVTGSGTTVVSSNATHVIIASADQFNGTVTSVGGGAGLTGSITTTGSLAVGQGTGIIVNADDIAVNASYIATISANNATYLNGQLAEYYTNATNISTGTLAEARLPYRMDQNVRTTDAVTFASLTLNGNLVVGGTTTTVSAQNLSVTDNMIYMNNGVDATITGLTANGTHIVFTANNNFSAGWDVVVTAVNPSGYNATYSNIFAANSTTFTVLSATTGAYVSGGSARGKTDSNPDVGFAAGYNDGAYKHAGFFRDATDDYFKPFKDYTPEPDASPFIDTANASFTIAGIHASDLRIGNTTVYGTINSTSFSGTANNATNFGGQAASFYTNATNITTGTLPYAQIPANIVNTTSNFTVAGAWTFNANTTWGAADHIILSSTSGISANGSYGTAGQVLHSNGTAVYWDTDDQGVTSVATANGLSGGTITTTGTIGLTTGSTQTVNSTGLHVNSTLSITSLTLAGALSGVTTAAMGNTTITGFANASVSVNSALLTVGTSFIANTTGAYHTGTINAASFTTTNFRANTTGVYPLSNTAGNALGNTISRWALSATTGSFAGAVDGITTLATGNTTITGFANATVSVNSALLTVGTNFIANTTGVTTTGFANVATTLQVGTNTATFGTATYMVSNGNLGVGTSTPGYKLEVNGSFAATTKSFLINHPTKEGMKLRYASLEGPENGVYVRGRLKDSNVIELPDYWTGLVDEDTITVNLTAIGKSQNLWVEDIVGNTIVIGGENVNCFYTVFAERKDVEKLEVEF